MQKISVGVLGATGSVGQMFIKLLSEHPFFELKEVAASERSAGKKYKEAANWILSGGVPQKVANLVVKNVYDSFDSKILFSGLDASIAGEVESELANRGHIIVSNSKNHRWDKDVPLLIPEVNYEHLQLLKYQKFNNGGKILTNPNCSTIGMVIALKPIWDNFGIDAVNVVTMQALSGAGYPGVASLDIIDNVIPFIGGEEDKLETEPRKILGSFDDGVIKLADIKISASCNRVAVVDGHTESVQIKLKNKVSKEEIIKVWNEFKSKPQELNLPFAPERPIYYFTEDKYPQPRLHRLLDKGMAVSVGRLRDCNLFDYKFTVLSHNTIRGAAGGSILCGEILVAENMI
ncbi:MAG TPA: aspartate-semialdehyde dehydrogenase [Ignavibacteriales bacterium]|nr:aspartate-semialdehyde dehydrogenase [Ignavibacteriales bacterium]